jgi:hypothetical protein
MKNIVAYPNKEVQARKLQVTIEPLTTSILESIAERDGTDPISLVRLQIAKFINTRWNFQRGTARELKE